MFKEYQHLERFGTTEVEGIEFGECHIFPKIDGTNASVWMHEGEIQAGSRTRHLSADKDNAGFYAWVKNHEPVINYLRENPNHRLFGEWLVPHSLKTYRQAAWRNFYVFDVAIDKSEDEILHEGDHKLKYLHYDTYKPVLEAHGVEYIPCIAKVKNPDYEKFINQLSANNYLIEDGKGAGEGIVIKNYDFRNKYGRCTFAKIVTSEFKEKHAKEMGNNTIEGKKMIEEDIADMYVTQALCEKVHAKIVNETGDWKSAYIPRLLNSVYYDLVKENTWDFVKNNKYPTINFKTLQHFAFRTVKDKMPQLF